MARANVRVQISTDLFRQVVDMPVVRQRCLEVAQSIAGTAQAIADAEQVDTEITVEDGTRPRGRSYARVTSSNVDAEHGTAATPRRRVLGRAAGIPTD
jgi:hypothetical protein